MKLTPSSIHAVDDAFKHKPRSGKISSLILAQCYIPFVVSLPVGIREIFFLYQNFQTVSGSQITSHSVGLGVISRG